ncbi:MAG: sugar phosphate isomerase/epimerase [Verrucomicrobia bacterium]|nr:sugar phosphate isomerase/epimerase [Verrucomicrobiota bacterium]
MKQKTFELPRRDFLKALAVSGAALAFRSSVAAAADESGSSEKTRLGFDDFSVRSFSWNADELIDYANKLDVDVLMISNLDAFENHSAGYLKDVRKHAEDSGIELHVGTWSICPTSRAFNDKYGTANEHLALAIRIASTVGSPVVRCVLGTGGDRYTDGGIRARIADTVKVCKNARTRALDAGIKIAIENHAGDMQARELADLIEEAGTDFVGATIDPGNAPWTIEAPMYNLEVLGPYVATSGIRDTTAWEADDGATARWRAIGEGSVNWKDYLALYKKLCPKAPFILEIISQYSKHMAYLKEDFWDVFPETKAFEFARFIEFAKRGEPVPSFSIPNGRDRRAFEREYQKSELERSIKFCKENLGLGLKT